MMTKKHFDKLAYALARVRPLYAQTDEWRQWNDTVDEIADMCQDDNPWFDRGLFYAACREEDN